MNVLDYIIMGILVMGVGPFGHLLARAIYLNGSLDKIWLTLIPIFWIPPFSIATYVAMIMGWVSQGSGTSPIDWNLFASLIGTMLTPLIFSTFELNEGFVGSFVETLIILLFILIPMFIREKDNPDMLCFLMPIFDQNA